MHSWFPILIKGRTQHIEVEGYQLMAPTNNVVSSYRLGGASVHHVLKIHLCASFITKNCLIAKNYYYRDIYY